MLVALGKAYQARGKRRAAAETFKATVAYYKRLTRSEIASLEMPAVAAVAESHFHLAAPAIRASKSITFRGSQAKQKKATSKKLQAVIKLKGILNEVIQYNHPRWAIAAFYALGDAYEDFANSIERAEVPSTIREGALGERYRAELTVEANKLRSRRAIVAYKNAVKIAQVQKSFHTWSEKALRALFRLSGRDWSLTEHRLRSGATGMSRPMPEFRRDPN